MTQFLWALACTVPIAVAFVDTQKWHGRSIYFVVTDRFAKSDAASDSEAKCDGKEWCGGTLQGVTRRLDYIQGMGFDAIWITPVVKQVQWRDHWNGTAYHGYWAADFFEIDPHLGKQDDLLTLKQECKKRNMLLMLDIVANHVGPIHSVNDIQKLGKGINSINGSQFHQLGRQPGQTLESYIQNPLTMMDAGAECWPYYKLGDGCNYSVILQGWFGDLADLRQEHPETSDYLLRWIRYMVATYDLDGLRLDTALYMPKWFLKKFQETAGVYMIGEVVTHNMSFHRSFSPSLTGLLNFPITEHLKRIFSSSGSMSELESLMSQSSTAAYPDAHLLGNFVDNHDSDRFLYNHSGDLSQLKNALTWTLLYHGLPIVYYGTEQVEVSNQRDSRTSMWPHFSHSDLYDFLVYMHKIRKDFGFAAGGPHMLSHAEVLSSTSNCMLMARAEVLVLVTNTGGKGGPSCHMCMPVSSLPSRWANSCSRIPQPLNSAPAPYCRTTSNLELCIQADAGQYALFAAAETGIIYT